MRGTHPVALGPHVYRLFVAFNKNNIKINLYVEKIFIKSFSPLGKLRQDTCDLSEGVASFSR